MPTDESQKRHAQEIATVRAISQMTGLGRSQIRDVLHGEVRDFAREIQANRVGPQPVAPRAPLMDSTLQEFQARQQLQSTEGRRDPTVQAVVVTETGCLNGVPGVAYTYALAAPVPI